PIAPFPHLRQTAARWALALVSAVPLAMLIVAGYRFSSAHHMLYATAAAALGLTVACGLLARLRGLGGTPVLLIYWLTTLCIFADILMGGQRTALAVLSDFP